MPHLGRFASIAALLALPASQGIGQTATQNISIDIRPISRLAVAGSTTMTIPARGAAGAPTVSTATATYAVTTNEDNRRITVALDEPMPTGVTLRMKMDAPAGAVAEDELELSTDPRTAVTGISRQATRDLGIIFSLETARGAVVPAATNRTVKVTMVSGV